jgi:hypothetical protein
MAILTQGTEVFVLAPSDDVPPELEVLRIDCPTAFDPGADTADQIDVTCLDERVARSYLPGLESPSESTLTISADPRIDSHLRLYTMRSEDRNTPLTWAIGWSDGTAAPTVNTAGTDFELPTTRSWFIFRGTISSFPFSFEVNSVVSSAITIQRSGESKWIPKS